MTTTEKPYTNQTYYALTLDPVHIGTGGYRLGRVDNSIMREPGTKLPKIPGSSLNGVCRANAALATERYQWKTEDGKDGSCAGQGQARRENAEKGVSAKEGHCGSHNCPVCVTFGFARGDQGGFQGLAQFSDARILFFPVHSMIGPVWVTCPSVWEEQGIEAQHLNDNEKVKLASGLQVTNNRLNLGWLMLECEGNFAVPEGTLPLVPTQVKERAVLVSDKLFSRIVNDNLEVRTSVSIDPATGAAEDGALYTYEAIPRATVLWFSVTYNQPKLFRIGGETPNPREKVTENGKELSPQDVVEKGLTLIEHLGIGGMNTRGMGRMRVLNLNGTQEESNNDR
jgi:CRISPR-associated protein Cmr4